MADGIEACFDGIGRSSITQQHVLGGHASGVCRGALRPDLSACYGFV